MGGKEEVTKRHFCEGFEDLVRQIRLKGEYVHKVYRNCKFRIPPFPQNETSDEVSFCGDILTFARTYFASAERLMN